MVGYIEEVCCILESWSAERRLAKAIGGEEKNESATCRDIASQYLATHEVFLLHASCFTVGYPFYPDRRTALLRKSKLNLSFLFKTIEKSAHIDLCVSSHVLIKKRGPSRD